MFKIFLIVYLIFTAVTSMANIQTKKIEYKLGDITFEGFLAYDDSITKPVPGVLIFHNWMGITSETETKVKEFAKLGVIAFAADIYGKGIRPINSKEASDLATKYKLNRALLRERVKVAFEELKKQKFVNTKKIITAGYCFGGTSALELGRSGEDLAGTISFHGGLSNPEPKNAKNMKGKILVFHGAVDPFVPKEEVDQFLKEMNEAKVDYEFTAFANSVHSFTDKSAGNDISKGAAYNESADKNSFMRVKDFILNL